MAIEPIADICPSCGKNPITDQETGFCDSCSEEAFVRSYWAEDAEALEVRRNEWKARSNSALAARERQHRSRLLRTTKPTKRAHAYSDPLEIAMTALQACTRIRQALRSNFTGREYLDQVEEALRQLAWGPSAPRESQDSEVAELGA